MSPKPDSIEAAVRNAVAPNGMSAPVTFGSLVAFAKLIDVKLDGLQEQVDALVLDGLQEDIEDDMKKPVLQLKLDRLQTSLDVLRGMVKP